MEEMTNIYTVLVKKSEGNRSLGKTRRKWDYIRITLNETGYKGVD
jgi:hypothetical protein